MGVHVEKSSLSDARIMHEDLATTKRARNEDDHALQLVACKMRKTTPARTTTRPARKAPVEKKALNLRDTDSQEERRWPQLCTTSGFASRCRKSVSVSRKRRLRELDERPTKCLKRSTSELDERSDDTPCSHVDSEDEAVSLCRPHTLEFALPGLSSQETLELLGELISVRHELSWLNSTRPADNAIIPVFGWRSAVWNLSTPTGSDAVVYKSAKAFEAISVQSIARKMWDWRGSDAFPELSASEQVYAISDEIRVVRQTDCLHGREPRSSLWLESIREQDETIFIVRKQLRSFQDIVTGPRSPCERECHGYILRPLLVPMRSRIVAGAALQSIGSLRPRGLPINDQIDRIVADMPRHVLQWEDCFVHDTSLQ